MNGWSNNLSKSYEQKYSGTRSRQDCRNKEHKWNYQSIKKRVFFIFSSGFFRYCTNQLQHNLNCLHMKQCPIWDESHWCGYIRSSRWVQELSYYFYFRTPVIPIIIDRTWNSIFGKDLVQLTRAKFQNGCRTLVTLCKDYKWTLYCSTS